MKNKKLVLTMAAVLSGMVAGGVLEHVRVAARASDHPERGAVDVKVAEPATVEKRDLMSLQSANDALRAANEQLRRRLAEAQQAVADNLAESTLAGAVSDNEPAPEERRAGRESFAERMERMRQENPEEYAEMQRRREEFRQQMEQRALDRNEFLAAVDVKNMSAGQRENHEKLLETLAHANSLMEKMGSGEGGRELWREMAETGALLNELYREERRYLFEETARSMGYQGNDSEAFADHLQAIIENTSIMPDFGRGRGGRGGMAAPR